MGYLSLWVKDLLEHWILPKWEFWQSITLFLRFEDELIFSNAVQIKLRINKVLKKTAKESGVLTKR